MNMLKLIKEYCQSFENDCTRCMFNTENDGCKFIRLDIISNDELDKYNKQLLEWDKNRKDPNTQYKKFKELHKNMEDISSGILEMKHNIKKSREVYINTVSSLLSTIKKDYLRKMTKDDIIVGKNIFFYYSVINLWCHRQVDRVLNVDDQFMYDGCVGNIEGWYVIKEEK